MVKFNVCPSTLLQGFESYSPLARKLLFDKCDVSPWLDFSFEGSNHQVAMLKNIGRVSVSGVQEKFSAVVENNKIRLARDGEQGMYILKPAPLDYSLSTRKQMPANENLTMQIASQVYSIVTAPNGLCFDSKGQPVYITKRFDIAANGGKMQMEDCAALLGRNELFGGTYFKYEGCYADIASMIKRHISAWPVALERFFSLVVFNYLYGNGDAHLKNFSFQSVENEYMMSPAYDLLNTSIHIDGDDFGLSGGLAENLEKSDIYVSTGHPCELDFIRFGKFIGLKDKRIAAVLKQYEQIPQKTYQLIANSFLNEKMKRSYRRVIEERHRRFLRASED